MERCSQEVEKDEDTERIKQHRAELEAEQKGLVTTFTKGYMAEDDLDNQMERIRSELFTLPVPLEQDAQAATRAALSAGETFVDMAGYWSEATPEERRDVVGGLLLVEGLIYDLERQIIVGLLPKPNVLPVLALGLERVEQEGIDLQTSQKLTGEQREEAFCLLDEGMSLRKTAKHFGISPESLQRLAKRHKRA